MFFINNPVGNYILTTKKKSLMNIEEILSGTNYLVSTIPNVLKSMGL